MIPGAIRDYIANEELSILYEIRDIVAELISKKEMTAGQPEKSSGPQEKREIIEERHSESVTYRLERVSCGKKCKGCPHGPYWYGYWREGAKTRSRYIGKNFKILKIKTV